ncbi:MAG: hypothetical protein MZW92_41450 [Comamonadaceae bacterium]|nr:hypothetical protein [Comamonadaceae bacterium]
MTVFDRSPWRGGPSAGSARGRCRGSCWMRLVDDGQAGAVGGQRSAAGASSSSMIAARQAEVFPCLKWAAYIAPAGTPKRGEEPAAYVVTLVDSKLARRCSSTTSARPWRT